MKKYTTFALVGLIMTGSAFAKRNVDHVSITSMINGDRQGVKLIANSTKKYGLVCSNVKLKIEMENPKTYMSVGEFEQRVDDIFLYPKKDQRNFVKTVAEDRLQLVNSQSEDGIIIRKVSVDQSKMKCFRATFSQYCRLAQKDLAEEFSLAQLGQKLKRSNCRTLAYKLNDTFLGIKKKLNLNDTYIMDFRFLNYLGKIRSVYVNNTYKDRSGTLEEKIKKGELNISIMSTQQELPEDALNLSSYIPQDELDGAEEFSFE